MSQPATPRGAPSKTPLPPQIPYIIANEGCERFSFYGMRNILTTFLATSMLMYLPEADRQGAAKDVFHTFVIGVYFFPLLGGWLADRFFGKYHTIFWLSLLYCVGHGMLAVFENNQTGFYTGLGLIALGSGGIKPLVASFMGDQFDQTNKHRAQAVFDAFYWIINFGSFFASLLMPVLLRSYGPSVAFGIPGILMFIATVVFWLGRHRYVHTPPVAADPNSFLRVVRSALLAPASTRAEAGVGLGGTIIAALGLAAAVISLASFGSLGIVSALCLALVFAIAGVGGGAWIALPAARAQHGDEALTAVRGVLRVLVIFALVTPFWSLFDQKASTWVFQAGQMTKPTWFSPAQMQALNPALVMLLLPFNNLIAYPFFARRGVALTPLRKMVLGVMFAGLSWIAIGIMQVAIDGGAQLSIVWQLLPYVLLTLGEVLVSATGLEFAYSQAPPSMKGAIMSFWNLAVTIGNLWVLLADKTIKQPAVLGAVANTGISSNAFLMFFFAGFALLSALAFHWYAKRYVTVEHYRPG